jgi:hypothetical protein
MRREEPDKTGDFRRLAARWWPQTRAVLLLLHVCGVLVLSFPGPYKLGDRARWKRERTQHEIAMWASRLNAWGWSLTGAELEAKLWQLTQRYLAVRRTLAAPFEPYAEMAGALQTWGMFKAPPRQVYALRILVRDGATWRTVYASRSSEHDYLARQLDHNRFRKQVGMLFRSPELFSALSTWVAKRAFDDFPATQQVRVDLERYDSLSPAQRQRGESIRSHVVARRLVRRPGDSP